MSQLPRLCRRWARGAVCRWHGSTILVEQTLLEQAADRARHEGRDPRLIHRLVAGALSVRARLDTPNVGLRCCCSAAGLEREGSSGHHRGAPLLR